jgi:hypothetical protein
MGTAMAAAPGVYTWGTPRSLPTGPPRLSMVIATSRAESHIAKRTPVRGLARIVTAISCTANSQMKSLCAPPEGTVSTAR